MKTKTEPMVCQECGKVLTSWDQKHTWFDCERHKRRLGRSDPFHAMNEEP